MKTYHLRSPIRYLILILKSLRGSKDNIFILKFDNKHIHCNTYLT